MPDLELFLWLLPSKKPGDKPRRTTYRLTREDAAQRYPGAVPDLSSREVRHGDGPGNVAAGIVAAGGGALK